MSASLSPPSQKLQRLGDAVLKRRLEDLLQALLAPIRARRAEVAADPAQMHRMIAEGTQVAREVTEATKREVMDALGLFRL